MTTLKPTLTFESLREKSCVALGALVGTLIALPVISSAQNLPRLPLLILLTVGGALVGFRRRKSIVFFYFLLFSILALSSLMMFAGS